jgi:hypothetical protein
MIPSLTGHIMIMLAPVVGVVLVLLFLYATGNKMSWEQEWKFSDEEVEEYLRKLENKES